MNHSDSTLKNFIHVERGIIPAELCEYIIKDIETRPWTPHSWYNTISDSVESEETMELDIQPTTDEIQDLLTPIITQAAVVYNRKYSYPSKKTGQIITKFSIVRFNRYQPGQIMRQHHDHIKSLFDGMQKGIPVLSFILNLNDDYEGAELFFWDDYVVPLGKGDIIMFPSLFLFPHGVGEAIKGKRYSGVCWGY